MNVEMKQNATKSSRIVKVSWNNEVKLVMHVDCRVTIIVRFSVNKTSHLANSIG